MKLQEAKAECERWLVYLQREKDKSIALQKLASERRSGSCSNQEMRRRLAQIDGPGIKVYDGANLEKAVRVLLENVD